ncbi:hypothetical protein Isop_1491 [Isosphaera pallida ATCC 43644]|uniref:Uncharacterized protein n=1 Tax=Isosphaera pallida (strain ATCC 43644 / DSM 9630 / IS1B) TaxID=575540 RepID=E8QYT9_ISOPI|nr:hypothetical protein [Isosphaera pallida]ADV62076.1 hypothetical protein Isop_1491 [Isosphaera pallida ATCC 43644]
MSNAPDSSISPPSSSEDDTVAAPLDQGKAEFVVGVDPPRTEDLPLPQLAGIVRSIRQYEFNENENRIIDGLSSSIGWAAWLHKMAAVVALAAASLLVFGELYRTSTLNDWQIPAGLALLGAAVWIVGLRLGRAARSFHEIVARRDEDVSYLIQGLRSLDDAFRPMALVARMVLFLGVVAVVLRLFWPLLQPVVQRFLNP